MDGGGPDEYGARMRKALLTYLLAAWGCRGPDSGKDTGEGTHTGVLDTDTGGDWEGPNDLVPGAYVSSTMWLSGGRRCARLGQLAFMESGELRAWSWTLCQDTWEGYADVVPVGSSEQEGPGDDAEALVQSQAAFIGQEPVRRVGTWEEASEGVVSLQWEDGSTESWARTWHDEALNKLELFELSAADEPGNTWLAQDAEGRTRDATARNMGVAFGGRATPGFETGLSALDAEMDRNYHGRFLRWNGYYEPPEDEGGVKADELGLTSFYLTDTGVARYLYGGDGGGMYVYAYLALPEERDGLRTRQIVYQTSHDFDNDGNIADGPGHTYAGLQILDATGTFRGVVFADQSYDTGLEEVVILSAMYYLDLYDEAAHEGTE